MFYQFKDPHTVFVRGHCYGAFALQPFLLSSRINGEGDQEIFISGLTVFKHAPQYAHIDLDRLVNATILSFGNGTAMREMQLFMMQQGFISKGIVL